MSRLSDAFAKGHPALVTFVTAGDPTPDSTGAILDALVGQGANQIQGPDLSVDDRDAAEDEARSNAIASARARAALYAKASGLSVDRIVWIRETGSNYAPRPMIAMRAESAKASTQIEPGEQDVTVNVAVRFLLK